MRPASLRGLALCVVEVGRNGDDCLGDRRAEEAFRAALELAKNERGNFRRSERLVAQLDAQNFARLHVFGEAEGEELQFVLNVFDAASHQALDGIHGAFRRFDQRIAGGVSDNRVICSNRARPPREAGSSHRRRGLRQGYPLA